MRRAQTTGSLRRRVSWLLPLAALLMLLGPSPGGAVTLPSGLTERTVLTGLDQPTAVRFSQDGRVFVAEKAGIITEFDSITDTTLRVYADLRARLQSHSDRGLLGIAFDPSFPTRSVIYALYTYDAPIVGTAPVWNDACPDGSGVGCKVSGRLSRILADGSEQVMINDWCQQFTSHSIGSLAFGPDGKLYVRGATGPATTTSTTARAATPPTAAPTRSTRAARCAARTSARWGTPRT